MCSGSVLELNHVTSYRQSGHFLLLETLIYSTQNAFIMKPPQEMQLGLAILCVYMSVGVFQVFLKPQGAVR